MRNTPSISLPHPRPTRLAALFLTAALTLAALAPHASAGTITDQIKGTTDAIAALLDDPKMAGDENRDARRVALRDILRKRFAIGKMAQLAVGKEAWKTGSEEEQKRFETVFEKLLEKSYIGQIESYGGQNIEYDKETAKGRVGALTSHITSPAGDEFELSYRVFNSNGQWLVYDVSVDGVSVVKNYQAQFKEPLQDGTFTDLLKQLEKKVE